MGVERGRRHRLYHTCGFFFSFCPLGLLSLFFAFSSPGGFLLFAAGEANFRFCGQTSYEVDVHVEFRCGLDGVLCLLLCFRMCM